MNEDIPWNLLQNHFTGVISDKENKNLEEWILEAPENVIIYEQLKVYFIKNGNLPDHFTPDSLAAFHTVTNKLNIEAPVKTRERNLFPLWTKIAAVAIIFVACYLSIRNISDVHPAQYIVFSANDSAIEKHVLPDGSQIWLNSGSKIRYTKSFKTSRNVYLIGEAYFEVSHDKRNPFKVYADNSVTTVVGTKFNIRSILHEKNIEITVNEGKVLFGEAKEKAIPLIQGKRGVLNKSDGSVSAMDITDYNYLSWKTKDFYFDNQPLYKVLLKLSEVYRVQFAFEDAVLKNRMLTAKFHQRPLSEIIQTLETVTGVKFTKTNNMYLIKNR